jgi:hypothetical protein
VTNQRKHVTQMSTSQREAIERYAHTIPQWSGLHNAHVQARKAKWGVTDADILNALWNGEAIEAHANDAPDIRFIMRHVNNTRAICVCASMRGTVVTVWVNRAGDNHYTLDHSQYQWRINLESVFNTRKG